MSANTLENVCENMLTHVHKVIHLVVGTFEQGGKLEIKRRSFCVLVIVCVITFRIDSRTIKRGETRREMRLSKCH